MHENIQEFVDSRGLPIGVERQKGIIRGVKILGVRSQNGRIYLAEAIERAVGLYEGAKVNVNHPKGSPAGARDYQDRIGVIRNVSARPAEGLFGDFHFNPKHALSEQLLWDAEHAPQNVGFSHNVVARTSRQGDAVVVEEIIRVQSVDLVADPATTVGLFEAAGEKLGVAENAGCRKSAPDLLGALTLEGLRRDRPDLVETLLAESAERIAALEAERDRLHQAEAVRTRRETICRLLAEFRLPAPDSTDPLGRRIVSETFLERLLGAEDEAAVRGLIQERAELVRGLAALPNRAPVCREQNPFRPEPALDVEAFVRTIS